MATTGRFRRPTIGLSPNHRFFEEDIVASHSNIVLTGFMGTGKSTVGKLLAELLRWQWVDTDIVIESRHGAISEIFANDGEEAFRDLEREVAAELATQVEIVVSTGGRLMLDPENIKILGSVSRVFCLEARPSEIVRRVTQDSAVRPLVAGDHPADRVRKLLAERDRQYKQFEQVATDGLTVEQVAQEIFERMRDSAYE